MALDSSFYPAEKSIISARSNFWRSTIHVVIES